jgi:hypothetical protein
MSDLRARLRELGDEEPPGADAFSAALHRRLSEAGAPDPLPFWRRVFDGKPLLPALTAAAALTIILAISFGLLRARPQAVRPAEVATTTFFPATKVAVVRVNLSAEVAVESADIRVELPDGLVFWADGEELKQRRFEWSQPLRAGDNEIPIAVRGLKPGKYKMTVSALIGSERVEDEVLLQVTDG